MINTDGEVSTLTLDVYWASGRPTDPALEQHIGGCARCLGYLARLDELAASSVARTALSAGVTASPD